MAGTHHDHDSGHSPGQPVDADDATLSFDARAATWDDDAKVARARQIAARIVAEIGLSGNERLFEYGAGTGLVSEALQEHVGAITMADASQGMRAVAQSKIDDGRLPGARVWDVDLSTTAPPSDEDFDLIVTSMVLHHVKELATTLEAFAALLTPGGHVCVVDLDAEDGSFHGPDVDVHHGFTRSEMADRLSSAGFVDIAVSDCGTVDHGDTEFSLFLAIGTR